MKNSKLILLLQSLSQSEFNAFHLFCQSPYYNTNEKSMELVDYLNKIFPDFENELLERKNIFNNLFSSEKYDEQKLRKLFFNVSILFEKFISIKSFENNTNEYEYVLLTELMDRKLNKYFIQKTKVLDERLIKQQERDSGYFYNQYRLNTISYKYLTTFDNNSLDGGLQKLVDNLDSLYLSQKLKFTCEMLNRKNILQAVYKINFIDDLLRVVEKSEFVTIPAISIYYNILQTLVNFNNESAYYNAKNIFLQNAEFFSKKEQHDIFTFLQNYCIKKMNTGHNQFIALAFENYKEMLTRKVIIDSNTMSHSDFKNIVTNALRLKEFEWTKEFIRTYSSIIESKFKKDAIIYNTSRLEYAVKNYKSALKNLQQVDFIDVFYNMDAKMLLIKIYYETGADESLIALFSSFKIYLKRNKKISDYHYAIYGNFIKYVRRLYLIKIGGKGNLIQIKTDIMTNKNVADMQWLLERIVEMEVQK